MTIECQILSFVHCTATLRTTCAGSHVHIIVEAATRLLGGCLGLYGGSPSIDTGAYEVDDSHDTLSVY